MVNPLHLSISSIVHANRRVLANSFFYVGLAFIISLVLLALVTTLGSISRKLQGSIEAFLHMEQRE